MSDKPILDYETNRPDPGRGSEWTGCLWLVGFHGIMILGFVLVPLAVFLIYLVLSH